MGQFLNIYIYIEIAKRLESAFGRFFHKPRGASSCMEIGGVNAHENGLKLAQVQTNKISDALLKQNWNQPLVPDLLSFGVELTSFQDHKQSSSDSATFETSEFGASLMA